MGSGTKSQKKVRSGRSLNAPLSKETEKGLVTLTEPSNIDIVRASDFREGSKHFISVCHGDGRHSSSVVMVLPDGKDCTVNYSAEFTENKDYRPCHVVFFMIIHCTIAFYYGYSYTSMNNLGKPICKSGMGITNEMDIATALGNINLFFGLGKMCGSFIAGSIQKIVGKLNLLYIAEILNVTSVVC